MRRIVAGLVTAAFFAVVPTFVVASNKDIADQVVLRLQESGQMKDYSIRVTYKDGTARLQGRVASEEQMNIAVLVAMRTPNVTSVENDLRISPTAAGRLVTSSAARTDANGNPLRNRGVVPVADDAQQPQKPAGTRRLATSVGGNETESDPSDAAERGSSSYFSPAGVTPASAEEPQRDVPARMAVPQRARPMDASRVAMMQPPVRGPAAPGAPLPMYASANGGGSTAPARYDQPCLPNYAWPSYAAYPNYAAVTYPKQYSPTAWPYIGPFYPYPQVPLGWRKVTLEWDDGWWFLDFKDQPASCWHR
jgi:hypothetical protein